MCYFMCHESECPIPLDIIYIFPVEKEGLWVQSNYGRWVTDVDNTVGVSNINSLQNGFLSATVRQWFDQYLVSVNPHVRPYSPIYERTAYTNIVSRRTTIKPQCVVPMSLVGMVESSIPSVATLQTHTMYPNNFWDGISASRCLPT